MTTLNLVKEAGACMGTTVLQHVVFILGILCTIGPQAIEKNQDEQKERPLLSLRVIHSSNSHVPDIPYDPLKAGTVDFFITLTPIKVKELNLKSFVTMPSLITEVSSIPASPFIMRERFEPGNFHSDFPPLSLGNAQVKLAHPTKENDQKNP